MFEKILVCLDGSKLAEQILPYATEVARRFNSKLILLRVMDTHTLSVVESGSTAMAVEVAARQMEKEQEEASAYLTALVKSLRDDNINAEQVISRGLHIGQTIIDFANERSVSLIAIATHGRSGFRRLMIGSVAEFVLKESGLPIMSLRPKEISES